MTSYRKKPVIVQATQWLGRDDYSLNQEKMVTKFRVLPYFHPNLSAWGKCGFCDKLMYDHGRLIKLEGGDIVCPGDWIIVEEGRYYRCKPSEFEATYEKVETTQEGE